MHKIPYKISEPRMIKYPGEPIVDSSRIKGSDYSTKLEEVKHCPAASPSFPSCCPIPQPRPTLGDSILSLLVPAPTTKKALQVTAKVLDPSLSQNSENSCDDCYPSMHEGTKPLGVPTHPAGSSEGYEYMDKPYSRPSDFRYRGYRG